MNCLRPRILTCLGILATLCFASSSTDAYMAGVKATGMAAVGVAYPQDAYAGAYNPAGIVHVCDRFDTSVCWIQDRGHARAEDSLAGDLVNGKFDAFKTKDIYNSDFGINMNFNTECFCNCWDWSLGLVIYNRDYQKTTYSVAFPLLGTSHLGLEYLHEIIAPVFALRINECHSIGISIDIHVQRAKVNGLEKFDNPWFSKSPGHVTNRGYDYSSGVGATIGWNWQVTECFALGVTYRPKNRMSRFKKYKGFIAQSGRLDVSQKWDVGLAWKFVPCATVAFDVEWINWKSSKSLNNPLLDDDSLKYMGSSSGPGFGFPNQTFYRLGLDYQLNDCWTFRAGYRHANCLVRKSQTAINLLTDDLVKDFVTVGLTYSWNPCNEISAFYAYGFSNTVKGDNSIPLAVLSPGGGGVVPLYGGNVNLTETKQALGLSWGYTF